MMFRLHRSHIAVLMLVLATSPRVLAELYSWTDEKGVKHFSTVPMNCITPTGTIAPRCAPPAGVIVAEPKAVDPPRQPASAEKHATRQRLSPTPEKEIGRGLQLLIFGTLAFFVLYLLGRFLRSLKGQETVYVKGPGKFDQEIVGESRYQGELKSICGGYSEDGHRKYVRAILILEDDNEHDSKAVRVDIEGMTMGYLTREDARIYRRRVAKAGKSEIAIECDAVIVGGWKRGLFDTGYFGVKLDLPVDQV